MVARVDAKLISISTVLLQALEVEPPAHAKCKDKFLVQSAFIAPDEEMKSLADMVSRHLRAGYRDGCLATSV